MLLFLCFSLRHEAGHEAVGDGGTDPYLRQHVVGVLAERFQVDVVVVERGYQHVDDADGPQVALGVLLPVLPRIEEGERAEQQHRQREAGQVEAVIRQRRRKQDVAQQHRHAHRHHARHGGNPDVEHLSILLESCLHLVVPLSFDVLI